MRFLNFKKYFSELKRAREYLSLKELLLRIIYKKYEALVLKKDLQEELQFNFKNKIELRTIESKHIQEFEELCHEYGRHGRNPGNIFKEYLENNCKGFFAILNKNTIGYVWFGNYKMNIMKKDILFRFLKDEIKLKDSDVYLFDLFIVPDYRGQGNSLQFLYNALMLLSKKGYHRGFGTVLAENKPALWTYNLLNFKEYKRMIIRRFFLFIILKNAKLFFDPAGHKWLLDSEN